MRRLMNGDRESIAMNIPLTVNAENGTDKVKGRCILGTYVMSDIHGCYEEFLAMLDKIGFSDKDSLIMAGDYIDRGSHSYEMLRYMEHCPANVSLIRGNHEEEFAGYVDIMRLLDCKEKLGSDFSSHEDTAALYGSVKYFFRHGNYSSADSIFLPVFDLYGTIENLINHFDVTLHDLCRWTDIIRQMPYYRELTVGGKNCVIVHAGYAESLDDIGEAFSSLEEFYLYARHEGYQFGGRRHGMVIAGHTPTIIKDEFVYNAGKAFRYYDKEKDCIFYDIDCGCVFRKKRTDARLACIRLEDEKIFYV